MKRTKVFMNLSQRDIENAEKLKELLKLSSRAGAVSAALGIAMPLVEALLDGAEVVIDNGRTKKHFTL